MKLPLSSLILVLGFTVNLFASDNAPSSQTNAKSPETPYDSEKPPSSMVNGQRFPPGTEIRTPYTKRTWVVQDDGTVKEQPTDKNTTQSSEKQPVVHAIPLLVEDLSKNPFWMNGLCLPLKLPEDTSVSRLVAAYLEKAQFKFGLIKDYTIEEVVITSIPAGSSSPPYTIARISSDQDGKFLIFQFHKDAWWPKSFDVGDRYSRAKAEQDSPHP